MKGVEILAKILGMKIFFSFEDSSNREPEKIVLKIDQQNRLVSNVVYAKKKNSITKNICFIMNIFYILLVFSLLSFDCGLNIYLAVKNFDYKYIVAGFMSYNFILQYINGINYFRKTKKTKIFSYEKKKEIIIFVAIIFIIVPIIISMQIIPSIFLASRVNVFMYSELLNSSLLANDTSYTIIYTTLFSNFFGYGIFFFNACLFTIIFIEHSVIISSYVKKIKKNIFNYDSDITTIDSMINEYLDMKNNYKKDVEKLNNIFSLITICLFISGYNMIANSTNIRSKYFSILHIVNIFLIVLVEIVNLIVVGEIKKNIYLLKEIVTGKIFVQCLLNKINTENIYTNDINEYTEAIDNLISKTKQLKDVSTKILMMSAETNRKIEWLTLVTIINEDWAKFNILGFHVEDETKIKQLAAIATGIILLAKVF